MPASGLTAGAQGEFDASVRMATSVCYQRISSASATGPEADMCGEEPNAGSGRSARQVGPQSLRAGALNARARRGAHRALRTEFNAAYAAAFHSNQNGFQNPMCRCVMSTSASSVDGEIAQCVPATPPHGRPSCLPCGWRHCR
jgi:hypothetical protein